MKQSSENFSLILERFQFIPTLRIRSKRKLIRPKKKEETYNFEVDKEAS